LDRDTFPISTILTSDVINNPVNPDSNPRRQYPSTNKLYFQTSDVICNPLNPVNPDSKPLPYDLSKLSVRMSSVSSMCPNA
ncbi:MAG: hypothetical protein ACK5F6_16020, partial [Bacteroidota bacterium]